MRKWATSLKKEANVSILFRLQGLKRNGVCNNLKIWIAHSPWEMLLQDPATTRGFPLTGGRWVHMWLKNDEIEMFCPGYLTMKFSKTKITPIELHFRAILVIFLASTLMQYTFKETQKLQCYLLAFFNPKKSQKVPKGAIICIF